MIDLKKQLEKGILIGTCLSMSIVTGLGPMTSLLKPIVAYEAEINSEDFLKVLRREYDEGMVVFKSEALKPENADNKSFEMAYKGNIFR